MIARRHSEAGFTLVELLVSLAIVAVLAGMVLAGVQLGFQTAAQARARGVGNASIITTQTVLRDRIEALAPNTRFEFARPIADIRGERTVFSFAAPAPPAERPASLMRYRLLRSAEGELVLFALADTTAGVDRYAPGQAGWMAQVLLTNVERLDIAYFGTLPGDARGEWRDQWIERGAPPKLVRIRVSFFEGDRRQWPDLVIRPAPTVNTACTIDPESGECAGGAA
ncbi:MAG TPA: type II secretion system protein [Erythrobacter sp.]|nr:type II secretion system protein [Erythrobacter sp.]